MRTPPARALAAAYLEYAWTHLLWVPRARVPPCTWTFLSSLDEKGLPRNLLKAESLGRIDNGGSIVQPSPWRHACGVHLSSFWDNL